VVAWLVLVGMQQRRRRPEIDRGADEEEIEKWTLPRSRDVTWLRTNFVGALSMSIQLAVNTSQWRRHTRCVECVRTPCLENA